MDLLIYQELADNYQIRMNEFFVNQKNNPSSCRPKIYNETHSKFRIQYDKCSTIKIVSFNYNFEFLKFNFFIIFYFAL